MQSRFRPNWLFIVLCCIYGFCFVLQFSKKDSDIVIQINISNRANKAGVLHVDVTDSGTGFESSAGARLFSPFVQLQQQKSEECDTEKNQQGFGLGLAIARDIVESSLNGRIFGKSAGQGQGACFGFDMPIELVDEEVQQEQQQQQQQQQQQEEKEEKEEEAQKKEKGNNNNKEIATEDDDCSETKCAAVSDERTSSKPLRIMCVDDSKVLKQEKKQM
jgi:hypothetical protein